MKLFFKILLIIFSIFASTSSYNLSAQATHPRLFFSIEDTSDLRDNAQTTHAQIWNAISGGAAAARSQISPPPECPTATSGSFQNLGQYITRVLFNYVITGDTNDAAIVRDCILEMADWPYWGMENGVPKTLDYGQSFMVFANALAYDWLYDFLTSEQRSKIRDTIIVHARRIYEGARMGYYDPAYGNWWRECYSGTHWIVNVSLFGAAALALEEENEEAAGWVDYVQNETAKFCYNMKNIDEGTWHESTRYQDYRLENAFIFYHNLKRLRGVDLLAEADDFLSNLVLFRSHNYLEGSIRYIVTHDDLLAFKYGGEIGNLRLIAARQNNGYAEWLAQRVIEEYGYNMNYRFSFIPEFFYYDPTVTAASPLPTLPLNNTYNDLGIVLWRTGWESEDISFGLISGDYGGNFMATACKNNEYPWDSPTASWHVGHDQKHANTFYLYKGNVDLASEKTGRIQNTKYHNTILVDDKNQFKTSDETYGKPTDELWDAGKIETVSNMPDFNFLCADATLRYRYLRDDPDGPLGIPYLDEFTRRVIFVRSDYIVMIDNLKAPEAHKYEWICHFGELPSMEPEEVHGVLNSVISVEENWVKGKSSESTAGDVLGIRVLSPESFAYTIDADTSRWARSESASSRYKPYIRIRPSSNIDNLRFINVLYPLKESTWSSKPTIELLGNTEDGCGLRVHLNGTQDHIIKYGEVAEVTIGEYIFKGEAASIIKESGMLTKLFAVNTSSLYESGGERLLASSLVNKSYEAVYSGNTLSLHSEDDLTGLKLYAPGITTVTVNTTPVTFIQDGEYIIISNGDDQKPTSPENLNAQVFYDRIEISWSSSSDNIGVEGYHLYRNDSLFVDLDDTNYVDVDFTVSRQYIYKALAYDAMGNTSPFSNVDTVTTLDLRQVLAHYKLDYDVEDHSGNDYNGEIQGGPVFSAGIDSIGLGFDGTDDYVLVNWENPPVQGENASFTFCSWLKTDIDTTQWVFGERDSYNAFSFGTYTSSGETRLQLSWYDGSNRVYFSRNWRPAGKGFMHIAGTYDASTKHVSLYLNGDKVLCDTATKPSGIIDLTPLTIGRGRYTNEAQYWNGILDDIRIYDVALSEQEIRSIFDEFNPDSAGIVGPDSTYVFFLYPNYPNPFNTTTIINYLVNRAGNIKFTVYDVLGREIKVLFEGYISAGPHRIDWDGTDSHGKRVSSGTYFYQIRGEDGDASSRKMIFLK